MVKSRKKRKKLVSLDDIDEKTIHSLAAYPAIIERGIDYYNCGMVENLRVTGNRIHANIDGNFGWYTITVELEDGDIYAECDCPFGGPDCKHVVAVLYTYYYEKQKGQFPEIGDDPDNLNPVDTKLSKMRKTELKEILLYLYKRFPDARREIDSKIG